LRRLTGDSVVHPGWERYNAADKLFPTHIKPDETILKPSTSNQTTAICILGMHRSGTSSITRAINLLGADLGEENKISGSGPDNPLGFWEHLDIVNFHVRLLNHFNRTWDTVAPLPDDWHQSESVKPFKVELTRLVKNQFGGHAHWVWKDPRTCLFMPLWREVLDELGIKLVCVFMMRNPLDVAKSLNQRERIAPDRALGLWYNYDLMALQDTTALPMVIVNYDAFIANWEPELRRCAPVIGLDWPVKEQALKLAMNEFIRPDLRHNCSAATDLERAPAPVRELCQMLIAASTSTHGRDEKFDETIHRLAAEFRAAPFLAAADQARSGRVQRTWQRWQKSLQKRLASSPALKTKSSGR
jgi:hypothetical protein